MTSLIKNQASTSPIMNLGKIFNYVITSVDMDQKWLADSLEISTSKMSRIMNGSISPDIEFWNRVCQQYGINFDAIQTGVITTYAPDSELITKRFAPDRKYNYTFGNTVLLHKSIFINYWGEKIFNEFCEYLGINPLLFVNAQNPANLDFTLRMMQYSILKGKIRSQQDIARYADMAFDCYKNKDKFHFIYSKPAGIDRVVAMVQNVYDAYERNHIYKIEDLNHQQNWVDISFYPREHVDMQFYKFDPVLGNTFEKYVHYYSARFMGSPVKIKTHESLFKGDSKCIFRLQRQ